MPATIETDSTLALPASSGQQRFWVLDQLHPGDPSLNVAVRFGLTGPLNAALLGRALNQIVARHEILRATFEMYEGQVVQLVAPALEIPVKVLDLRGVDPAEADRLAEIEARAPFSLAAGPLLRAGLLRIDDQEHVLLITIHHIVSDGWSIGVITDELGPLYEALIEGRPSPLPELAIQYADYTLWEEENRDSAAWRDAGDYWKRQLAHVPQFEVRPDRERTGAAAAEGHIVSRLLPFDLTDRLRELSQKNEATLFMTMLAGLAALLHRYTGETDIVTGSQVVGRNNVEVEPLIGPFINTLVLRTDASGDPAFTELLARAREMVSEALAHQSYPLDRVAETLRVERCLDRNLLFQINFIYQRDFVRPWEHGGVRMRAIPSKSPGAMYDLNIFLVERAEGWRVSCEYNTALYFPETVARLLEHFERLLGTILEDPQRRISEYRFLSAEEENRLLSEWNRTAADYPRGATLPELFEERVQRSPDAVAVTCRGESLTYAELNARANRLARHLRGQGVGADKLVGISLSRSLGMLVSVLAVLKAGGAYAPLDPGFPVERLTFMAEDAGLCLRIDEAWLEGARKVIAQQDGGNLPGIAGPEDLAYVIYTSGSTGKPKGVEIHHRALVNLLWAAVREPGLAATDTLLAITTLSFDISALELFAPLIAGARILLAAREQAGDGLALRNLLMSAKPSVLQATPATWRMLIDAGWMQSAGLKMLCGGEALTRDLADALLERGDELWNMYGPTETTIWSSWKRIERGGGPVTIGRAAPNQSFYVLDDRRSLAPTGAPGELYIGGDGVARGYHNRPQLTVERFLENPFAPGRMYRTGDRARWRPDGSIEVLGRVDSQVKVRGFRIELGEIEAALAACPLVRNAAVVVREDVLAGYFVPFSPVEDSASHVREHLKLRLPDYMVPTHLMALPELPHTPNGKIDRKALPSPEARVGRPSEGPRDALETTLTGIWESVLHVHPIQRTDNFFEIGGHSVLAARMFARMEKVLGKTLPLATLFQGPTIEKLAGLLRDGGWTPPWSSLVPIRPGGTRPPFFFVHAIGGNVLSFAGFAGHFDADQPVYGLQARGLDGEEAPHTAVEGMAEDYIREMRTVQPVGPYYIGGFSAGGVVAFEMARQLKAAGQEVGVLALLDSKMEGQASDLLDASSQRLSRWTRTLRFNLHFASQIGIGEFARRKLQNWKMRVSIFRWRLGERLGWQPGTLDAEEAFLFALRQYRAQTYEGGAILFRAKDELVRYPDPNLGWGDLVRGGIAIQEISGDHDTLLTEPHIGMLARVLDQCLQTAQGHSRILAEV